MELHPLQSFVDGVACLLTDTTDRVWSAPALTPQDDYGGHPNYCPWIGDGSREHNRNSHVIVSDKGQRVSVQVTHKGRIEFGFYPMYDPDERCYIDCGSEYRGYITVSRDCTPDRAAKAFRSRLLPSLDAYWSEATDRKIRRAELRDKRDNAIVRIGGIPGVSVSAETRRVDENTPIYIKSNGDWYTYNNYIAPDGTVSLDIRSLDTDTATKLIRILTNK